MSAHLEAVRIARDHRASAAHDHARADQAYRQAIVRASSHHSLRQIAAAAGVTFSGVRYIIRQERDTP